jgi:hypothetical protein
MATSSKFLNNPYNLDYLKKRGWRATSDQISKIKSNTHTIKYIPVSDVVAVGKEPSHITRSYINKTWDSGHTLPMVEGAEVKGVGYALEEGALKLAEYILRGYKQIPVLVKN